MTEDTPVTVEFAARLLGMTPRHLQRLSKLGFIRKPYTLGSTVAGYVKWRDDCDTRGTASAARVRIENAKARMAELRAEKLADQLISIDDAVMLVDSIAGVLRSEMVGLPAVFTRDLTTRQRLQDLIDGIFNRACDRLKRKSAELNKKEHQNGR